MKQFFMFSLTIAIAIVATIIVQLNIRTQVEESIKYFPISDTTTFESAFTTISIQEPVKSQQYSLLWRVYSTLDKKTYLRQDISFLFINGRLQAKLGKWKENEQAILLQKKFTTKGPGKWEAISFHHAEIHEQGKTISSAQMMSEDHLYVIDSPSIPTQTFRNAKTIIEKQWVKKLEANLKRQANLLIKKAARTYTIDVHNYDILPLTALASYNQEPLPGFTFAQSQRVIGQLWEGLYKNYFLGIKKEDGTVLDVINSSIPLLLFAKDQTNLLVIFEDTKGEINLLRQSL